MYQSTTQRSHSTKQSLSPKNAEISGYYENKKRSTGSLSQMHKDQLQQKRAIEDKIKRFGLSGSNKALNRGFYDRYQVESVLVAARDESKRTINQDMAELMSKEKEDLFKPDLVMVPSFRSVTGWQYVKNDKI